MTLLIGIPLGQNQDGTAQVARDGKQGGAYLVVFRVRRSEGAGEGELTGIQPVIPRRFEGKEAVGIGQGAIGRTRA